MKYDLIILDAVGVPFTGYTPDFGGLGGSEWEQVLLLEALAAKGLRIASINRLPSWSKVRGVDYWPLGTLEYEKFECKSLVLERQSPRPLEGIVKADNVFRWITDANAELPADNADIVCVSAWQRALLPASISSAHVIHNMLPDWVYDLSPNRNTQAQSFIYASAAVKGLAQTLQYFQSMRKTKEYRKATLKVLNPGYDLPRGIDIEGVTFLGALPFKRVVEEMQTCRSMLMTSTFPETFGIVQVLAEVLGLNVFVHQSAGKDALSEVCNSSGITHDPHKFNTAISLFATNPQEWKPVKSKDFRVSTILPRWLDVLGLERHAAPLRDGGHHEQLLV